MIIIRENSYPSDMSATQLRADKQISTSSDCAAVLMTEAGLLIITGQIRSLLACTIQKFLTVAEEPVAVWACILRIEGLMVEGR